jgi:predicted transcriptional regulator
MIIENLMTRSVITLPSSASVYEAVKLMNENKIGCLVVVYNSEIVGF